jgi:hypothetical protein
MNFLTWRLYRVEWAIALALLAAFTAVELATGLPMMSRWHTLMTECGPNSPQGHASACKSIISAAANDLRVLSVTVPVIIGILWGAPLVAHETETGTRTFAWTQGVTRARWLLVKSGWLLLASALVAAAVAALVTWSLGPDNAMRAETFSSANYFDVQGIVPVGYAVFATALGITAGVLLRRLIPAIAVTLGVFIGVRLLVDDVIRHNFMPAVTTIVGATSTWEPPGLAWVLGTTGVVTSIPCGSRPSGGAPGNGSGHCLETVGQAITYQPGYRYWPFQFIETGLYVALATGLLALAIWLTNRRDA